MLSLFLKTFVFVLLLGCSVGIPSISKTVKLKIGGKCFLKKTRKAGFIKRISGYTPHEYYFKKLCVRENWGRHFDKLNPLKKDRLTFQLNFGEQHGLVAGDTHTTVEIVRKAMLIFSQSPLKLGVELVNPNDFDNEGEQQVPVYRLFASDLPVAKPVFYDESMKSFYIEQVEPVSGDDKYGDFDSEEEEEDDEDEVRSQKDIEVEVDAKAETKSRRLLIGRKQVNLVKTQLLLLTKKEISKMKLKKNKKYVMFRAVYKKTKVKKDKQITFESNTAKLEKPESKQVDAKTEEKYTAAFYKAVTGEVSKTFQRILQEDPNALKIIFGAIDTDNETGISAKEFKLKASELIGKLSKEEQAVCKDVFNEFDENADGLITYSEFQEGFEKVLSQSE